MSRRLQSSSNVPRWVIGVAAVAAVLVMAFLAFHFSGGMPMSHGL